MLLGTQWYSGVYAFVEVDGLQSICSGIQRNAVRCLGGPGIHYSYIEVFVVVVQGTDLATGIEMGYQ